MTGSLDIIPKITEHNLIVHIGKSEAEVTNNKRLHLRYCNVEAILTDTKHRTASLRRQSLLLHLSGMRWLFNLIVYALF